MKRYLVYISVLLVCACSTKKDKFVNRKYHALITKFNVFYNGQVAYEKGLEKVEKTYSDDFMELLPVEPFSFYDNQDEADDVKPIGQADFERAEEKAAKAIQRHSMLIEGEERNSQIDETYLLLGKSRYYTRRFGPALESFEYIIKNYPEASLIYETVVWRAKSNIHINNIDFAKRALRRLLSVSTLPPEVRQQAEVGLAMAYQKSKDSLGMLVKHLENSIKAVDEGSVASRVGFILGQAYKKQGKIAKSDRAFDRVIDMKGSLYRFRIQAKLEKMNNHLDEAHRELFLEELDHLIFITKNRRYLGKLLHQKGLIFQEADSINLAKRFYTESILKSSKDVGQKILSYEKMGDMYFDEKLYKTSKSYYDSLISIAQNKKSKRVIRTQRISKSLERIVDLEDQAIVNDSLLNVAGLNEKDVHTFFENYIEQLKEQEKQARIKELKALESQNNVAFEDGKTDWYFFNNKERVKGKIDFVKQWRVTKKNKNWFASSLSKGAVIEEKKDTLNIVETKDFKVDADENNKYKVAYYTSKINREPKFLDSIFRIRNLNYYELGNIYYNQLKEKELAVEKLETLIDFKPSKDLKVGTYYRLFKIHQETEDVVNSAIYRQKLNTEFPESSFTKLVNHKKGDLQTEEQNEYITCYETIYKLYLLNSFDAAKEEITSAILNFGDSPLAAKYHLLQAFIFAKTEGEEKFYELLKEIKLKYPNTIESEKAGTILNNK